MDVIPATLPAQSNLCVYQIPPQLSTSQYLRLWTAYINSGLHPLTFLQTVRYPNPENKALQRRLHYDLREHLDSYPDNSPIPSILLTTVAASPSDTSPFSMTLDEILNPADQAAWAPTFTSPTLLPSRAHVALITVDPNLPQSEQLDIMRRNLIHEDWGCAQALARKTLDFLDSLDPKDIKPADLRSIAATFLDIQKIKRMALGLSSENVGFKVEGKDAEGNDLPVINVQIASHTPAPESSAPAEVVEADG